MASSARKIASARANGAKSPGPSTALAKQTSALNAITHGLTARTVVLFNESTEEYQAQLTDYLDHFRPQTKPEADLVYQLAAAHWRVARYAGVESGLLEQRMQHHEERLGAAAWHSGALPHRHGLRIALGTDSSFALLNRYQARLHLEYQRRS